MTTPQDIQEALDEMIDGRAGVGDWFLKHKETLLHVLQSHAPTQNVALNEAVQAIGRQSKNKKFHSEVIGDLTILKAENIDPPAHDAVDLDDAVRSYLADDLNN